MRASGFEYVRPESLDDAVAAAKAPGAVLTAGGQSLLPALVLRERRASRVVDISRLPALLGLSVSDSEIVVGAAEPLRTLERSAELRLACPILERTIHTVAAMAIRSRCTLGGSLAWADPTSQLPAVLAVLGARVRTTERRSVAVLDLLGGGLVPGEVIVEVTIPVDPRRGHGLEHVRRTHITWPVAGAVATYQQGDARVALYGAGPTCVLIEQPSVDEVLAAVGPAIEPFDDEKASAAYRRRVLPALARRALTQAKDMIDARD